MYLKGETPTIKASIFYYDTDYHKETSARVFEIDMFSSNNEKTDYWRVDWSLAFFKDSQLAVQPKFLPWNIISLYSTYERLQNQSVYSDYIACVKELISALKPFYASIDDVDNKVKLAKKAHIEKFVPDHIQQIYWGNYWGKTHCRNIELDKLRSLPVKNFEIIGNGVLFFLSDNIFDFASSECKRNRKKVKQYLKQCTSTHEVTT